MDHLLDLLYCWIGLVLSSWLSRVVVASRNVATVRMLVSDEIQVLQAGQSAEIACEFYMQDFDMFDNPIVWKKTQRDEQSKINIMGNIVHPFVDTGRFRVTFVQRPPRYRVLLSIADISLEDYGNYTCEVRGTHTTTLASLTYYLFVKSPVREITISDSNRTVSPSDVDRSLVFSENTPGSLSCVSYGGCPPPEMTVYLGKREITAQFDGLQRRSMLTGERGLRLIEPRTELRTDRFKVTSADNGKRLQCVVSVPGMGSNVSTVKIKVHYAPIVRCDQTHAFLDQKNVFLRCSVRSNPSISRMYWIVNEQGTTLTQGKIHGEYWALTMDEDSNGVIDSRLYMKVTRPSSFRVYTLVAENNVGVTSSQVTLLRKFQTSPSRQSDTLVVDPTAIYAETRQKVFYNLDNSGSVSSSGSSLSPSPFWRGQTSRTRCKIPVLLLFVMLWTLLPVSSWI